MKLQKKRREREVKQYGYEKCAEVLIAYILKGKTQREIDEEILAPRRATQNGFDANAILGHFGITKDFPKDFVGTSVIEFIEKLEELNDPEFEEIIGLMKQDCLL